MQADGVEIDGGIGSGHHLAASVQGRLQVGDIAGQGGQGRGVVTLRCNLGALGQPGVLPGRVERLDPRIVHQGAILAIERRGGEQGRRASCAAGNEQGRDVLIAGAQGADGARVAEPAGGAHVLHAVQTEGQGRIVIVRGDVHAPGMGPLDQVPLGRQRQADIGLDQVVGERLGAFELQGHLAGLGHRAHEVVIDPAAVDGLAGGDIARAHTGARVQRLAILHHVVGGRTRRAGGGDPKRQP